MSENYGWRLFMLLGKHGLYLEHIPEMKIPTGQILVVEHYSIRKF